MAVFESSALGLYINDGSDILRAPLAGIIYGTQGVGKTTEAARAYPNGLFCVTSEKNLRAIASSGIQTPHFYTLPVTDQGGNSYDLLGAFGDFMYRVQCAVSAGNFPYDAIIIDEYTMLAKYIEPMLPGVGFDHIKAFHNWHGSVCAMTTYAGVDTILLGHEQEPKYNTNPDAPAHLKGKLQYRGGPQVPIGTAMDLMVSLPDYCLRVMVKAGGNVVVLTRPDPLWRIKARDLRLKKEEKFELRRIIEMMKSAPPLDEAAQRKLITDSHLATSTPDAESDDDQAAPAPPVPGEQEAAQATPSTAVRPGTTNAPGLAAPRKVPGVR